MSVEERIRFAQGDAATMVQGGVIRGGCDIYLAGAREGQYVHVGITSFENNAVFQIYRPGARYTRDSDGSYEFTGRTVEGAGELDDATQWSGELPESGDYMIVIGATRGNTKYFLTVAIA